MAYEQWNSVKEKETARDMSKSAMVSVPCLTVHSFAMCMCSFHPSMDYSLHNHMPCTKKTLTHLTNNRVPPIIFINFTATIYRNHSRIFTSVLPPFFYLCQKRWRSYGIWYKTMVCMIVFRTNCTHFSDLVILCLGFFSLTFRLKYRFLHVKEKEKVLFFFWGMIILGFLI